MSQAADAGDHDRERELDLARHALGIALGDLEEVVPQADRAERHGDAEHDPDIAVGEVGPQQRRDRERDQDQEPAHGRRALLADEVAGRTVLADRLALLLLAAQPADQAAADQEAQDQRRQEGRDRAERQVAEQIERA